MTITSVNGNKIKGVLHDISPDGTQIRYASSDGIKIFQHEKSQTADIKNFSCILQFDLAFSKSVLHVRINAHPVYLRPISGDTLAAGMFFSEEDLQENKKISDFLFHQLQVSFSEIDYIKEDAAENKAVENKTEPEEETVRRTVLEHRKQSDIPGEEKVITAELEELILQMNYPKEQLEPFRQLLFRVLSSLKVIQETARHIEERIKVLEHKISRRN